jgi:hypothetical protein
LFDKGFVHLPVSPCIWTRKSRYDIRRGCGAGTNGSAVAFNIKAVGGKEGLTVDISMMIRWIVVFLVIFVLLMFFVFSFFKKQSTA